MDVNSMMHEDSHLSDQALLLSADGELPPGSNAQVRAHLAGCWECRARMAEVESAITDFVRVHRRTLDPRLPPIAGPRALLKAQLAELAGASHPSLRSRLAQFLFARRQAYLCAGLAVVMMMAVLLYQGLLSHKDKERRALLALGSAPNAALTPGDTRLVAKSDVCAANRPEKVPAIPVSIQRTVLKGYGIVTHRPDAYELDFLITPELGGTASIRNLWPEPYHHTVWNAHVKDQLEEYLHQSVCNGALDLATAQRDIAVDWIAAYKNYFHTDQPLSAPQPPLAQFVSERMPTGSNLPVSFRFQQLLHPALGIIPFQTATCPECRSHKN